MDQANSDLWHSMRKLSITGTKFKKFSTNPIAILKEHYFPSENVGDRPAVKWGRDHELDCIVEYNSKFPDKITQCGCFISKNEVNILASPDGLILSKKMVVEAKCPLNRRDVDPNIVIPDFCYYDDFGKIQLKKNHQYFFQIQCQMFVVGFKKGKFLV